MYNMETQRTHGYTGGIKSGTTATSVESAATEEALRSAVKLVNAKDTDSRWVQSISAGDLSKRLKVPEEHIVGLSPDGGLWLTKDHSNQVVLAAEAKKQGLRGNAIERWYKNWAILSHLEVGVYITVCVGEGFFRGNSAQRTLEAAVALEKDGGARLEANTVWNCPTGRLWLYRYETAPTVATLQEVLLRGLQHGKTRLP